MTARDTEIASPGRTDVSPQAEPVRPDSATGPSTASLRVVAITLAAACGLTVANLYYAQPLLAAIARAFGVSPGTSTIVVTATQVGYAAGLILLLPLGDLLENRKLASRLLIATAAALVIAAVAPSFWLFLVMAVLIGVTSVVAQILVPLVAHLAPPAQRGKFVGQVMSGLLIGILLARTVASEVASLWGWRSIYAISAGLMIVTSIALARILPRRQPDHQARYRQLMASVVMLARSEPLLRRRAAGQALMFGAFTCFWTGITYELIDAHHLTQAEIGLFALVGAAGAAAAPLAGFLGDRGFGPVTRPVAAALGVGAMLLAGLGAHSLILLAAGGVMLDLAVQSHQVISQREIYSLRGDARARINSVFMGSVFIGGAIASVGTGILHATVGWLGVTLLGACLCAGSVALSLSGRSRSSSPAAGVASAA